MNRPRVLVVEDRPGVLKLIATVLEVGCEVTSAADGATAISLLGAAPFDVVLTDIRLTGASGFDVLRAVQSHAHRPSVVLMTAYANLPDAVAAMRLGAFDYVAKPLAADEIALVVARAVEHRRKTADRPLAVVPDSGLRGGEGHHDLSLGFRRAVDQARERASVEYLVELMRHFHGNVTLAAVRAGMARESLHRLLKQYGIHSHAYRDPTASPEPEGGDHAERARLDA
ncbi:MAG TPA: response regulator [Anaeromyxobacter sp.]|nr:response regulator [Anaeromyxobacter sp.]